jgi:hypothetical protein
MPQLGVDRGQWKVLVVPCARNEYEASCCGIEVADHSVPVEDSLIHVVHLRVIEGGLALFLPR